MMNPQNVAAAARQFAAGGGFVSAEPYGTGHINDTFRAVFEHSGVQQQTLLQRINHHIFKHPARHHPRHLASRISAGRIPSRAHPHPYT